MSCYNKIGDEHMFEKLIFHIDVNNAFLSWEAVKRIRENPKSQDLRKVPSAVGGDMAKRKGVILAKSIPAKSYKITTGEPLTDALKKCPSLLIVSPDFRVYEKASEDFISILKEYSPDVEKYSIDEAFIDMTTVQKLFGNYLDVADEIKDRIERELGFTVNIGISSNKLLAKMASDFKKPNLIHTLFPEEIKEKMWPLPVRELLFVGKATEERLYTLGIKTIGQLAGFNVEILKVHLKKQGEIIWKFANGIDVSVVEEARPANKGYGNSTTISFDVTDKDTARMILLGLAETVALRLRKEQVKIQTISVGIKYFDFNKVSHQKMLEFPTNITNEIYKTAVKLFDEIWDGTPIRLLGIQTSRIIEENAPVQLSLFDEKENKKYEKVDKAVDEIRTRFGSDSIMRASFLGRPHNHMEGGISQDRWKQGGEKITRKKYE